MNPLISIVIPIYNSELYLNKCLDSVVNQTFEGFEVILVNDGSKDNSLKICEEYCKSDARFKVFSKENGGVSSARNLGLQKVKGKYVAFLDSDDSLNEEFLEIAYQISEKENSQIFMCGYVGINENSTHNTAIEESYCIESSKLTELEMIELMSCNYITSVSAALFRYDLIKDKKFNENLCFGEDLKYCFDLILDDVKIYFSNKCLYNYLLCNSNSLVHTINSERCYSTITIYSYLYDHLEVKSCNGILVEFLNNRWIDDFKTIHRMILENTKMNKLKLLKILTSNRKLNKIIVNSNDKYLRKYAIYPVKSLLYELYKKIRKC